jgi:hypothetical protein
MTHATAVIMGVFLLLAIRPSAQRSDPSADLVELDVVVLDGDDRPIRDLRQEDFEVKEDGQRVDVKTFAAVVAVGTTRRDDARSVVLLMDDSGIDIGGTAAMKAIAAALLSPTGPGDDIAVVRLNGHGDEAYGDVATAVARIGAYRGGVVPFSRRQTNEDVLRAVARVSRELEPIEHRRKIILCLGVRAVCGVDEPVSGPYSVLWQPWVDAITASAAANVSVYSVDPTGLMSGRALISAGLVPLTGGTAFGNSNDFTRFATRIWSEASHYYLLGYWPAGRSKPIHSIEVKVARKGAHVHTRHRRGP